MGKKLDKWVKNFITGCINKKAYRTLGFAEEVAKKVYKERGIVLHCYLCKDCGCYHLTKQKSNRNIF